MVVAGSTKGFAEAFGGAAAISSNVLVGHRNSSSCGGPSTPSLSRALPLEEFSGRPDWLARTFRAIDLVWLAG